MKTTKKLLAAAAAAVLMLGTLPIAASANILDPPDTLTQMFERIAGWDGAALEDCIIRNQTIFTPLKDYFVTSYSIEPYRVTVGTGTELTAEEIREAWKTILEQINSNTSKIYEIRVKEIETDGTYLVYMYADSKVCSLMFADCFTLIPQVQRVEGMYCYHTNGRVNSTSIEGFIFDCDFTPTAEDFPDLEVSKLYYDEYMNHWVLEVGQSRYQDYFNSLTYMESLDFLQYFSFIGCTTELRDGSDYATLQSEDYETVFYRGDLNKDGEIDVRDAVLLARLTAEDTAIPVATLGIVNADVDGDGYITLLDTDAILAKIMDS